MASDAAGMASSWRRPKPLLVGRDGSPDGGSDDPFTFKTSLFDDDQVCSKTKFFIYFLFVDKIGLRGNQYYVLVEVDTILLFLPNDHLILVSSSKGLFYT